MKRACVRRYGKLIYFHHLGQAESPFLAQTAACTVSKSDGEFETPAVLHLFWHIRYEYCDWKLWIITPNYTLYPLNPFVNESDVPITENTDYNVTLDVTCDNEAGTKKIDMNISLSILLNDNVLENVPYIVCHMIRSDSNYTSKEVYPQSYCDIPVTATQYTHTQITSTQAEETSSIISTHSTKTSTVSDINNMRCTTSSADRLYQLQYQVSHLLTLLCLITLLCCL